MKTLYALLVGVGQYQHLKVLNAPTADVQKINSYLHRYAIQSFQPKVKILEDAQATKAGVVTAFEEQLIGSDATKEDVLLFYFSGHGAQEEADPVFWKTEVNRKLENIACQDADLKTGKGFLADKELRWLLSRAAKNGSHVVALFDCCHAGDNTRAGSVEEKPEEIKRLGGISKQRDWSDFIFSDIYSKEDFKNENIEKVIPQGRHITLAACQSFESAYENRREGGYFTHGLLKTLERMQGDISYFDLKGSTKNFVRMMRPDQTPQIYTPAAHPTDIFQTFLGGAVKDKPLFAKVNFNFGWNRWELDMGAIYGVTQIWKTEPQKVVVQTPDGEAANAYIKKVFPDSATVDFEPYSDVRKGEEYSAYVPSLMTRELKVWLDGDILGTETFLHYFKKTDAQAIEHINITKNNSEADFWIRAQDNQYLITLPEQNRPLTGQEERFDESSVTKIIEKLQKIVKWHFVKSLDNIPRNLSAQDIELEFLQYGQPVPITDNTIQLDFKPPFGEQPKMKFQIKMTNRSQRRLHATAVYLGSLFDIGPTTFYRQVLPIEPGNTAWSKDGQATTLVQEDYITQLGWEEEVFYIKIIYSTANFDVALYRQKRLDAPRPNRKATTRGALAEDDFVEGPDWCTRLIEVHLKNAFK